MSSLLLAPGLVRHFHRDLVPGTPTVVDCYIKAESTAWDSRNNSHHPSTTKNTYLPTHPEHNKQSIMGSIFSAIGSGIIAIISAIAGVLETIISAIFGVIATIFNVIGDILCCRCGSGRRRSGGGGIGGRRRMGRSSAY
ncbi:hypothetical protein DFH11DRAFT_591080 [Phellopilus nigrolimitatus]|nr:hypothetical protein DFH11DRAFT_591080 [Phellopilus nigrolimitatus]